MYERSMFNFTRATTYSPQVPIERTRDLLEEREREPYLDEDATDARRKAQEERSDAAAA